MTAITTLRDALAQAQALGLERIDAQLLLLHILNRADAGRAWLLAHDTDTLAPSEQARFAALCQRRAAGEPVAYLRGCKEFYGLTLHIDARVLDPRPDTETLVDWALQVLAPLPAPRVLDLGTGSGAIALALQHQRPDAQVSAVDASADALAVAQANAARLGLAVQFAHGDWLRGVVGQFDAIVSNPPYIAAADPHLEQGDVRFEPRSALAAGPQGLDNLAEIVAGAPARLIDGGWLFLEHGYDQAVAARSLLADAGFAAIASWTDLAGIERVTGGRWLGRRG